MSVSGRGAKAKGDNYERELAAFLKEVCGIDCYRTPLSGMRGGRETATPDISGTPHIAIEAKRTEVMSPRRWMTQAEDAAGDCFPVVMTRQSRMTTGQSFVFMRLSDWVELYKAYLAQQEKE